MPEKITLIGRAGVGKTSILNLLFEGGNPADLMLNPLEPTRGIIQRSYSWMDIELSIFDTSGQELPFLLLDENDQIKAFQNAGVVIYILDYPIWIQNSQEIIKEVKLIFEILKVRNNENNLVILFHKIDLINQKVSDNFHLMKRGIKSRFTLPIEIPFYFTSIYPEIDYTIFNAFSEILSNLSQDSKNLKIIIDENIKNFTNLICFITNSKNYIIVQSMTNDFNTELIYKIYFVISYYIRTIDGNYDIKRNIQSISSGVEILKLIVGDLEIINPELKKLIIFSENNKTDEISNLKEKIKLKIENYYKIRRT